ncbi:hypothetical protein [Paenibacillus sp. MMS20-IR301]|uniref:hypothetical protein n=1 Tax=Paenibacillus sp. MMS20-IR301 TaxID=2895946 RepID=UPI0028EC5393|nr:hypothetical protein [Paenibacillus sp. MMS20-IR301]WNS44673.1 hypothetical protein LOS79_05195 [Paenibacillus sp. MMS20-IR301]
MKRLALLLLAMLLTAGCNPHQEAERIPQQQAMPEEMPADFDFLVRYGYGELTKNEINTYHDTVVKDLIVNGTATANLSLSEEDLAGIYERMRAANVMGELELKPSKQNCAATPSQEDQWQITADGITRTLSWSDEYCEMTDDAKQLLELRNYIRDIVAAKAEYQALPEAEGGYD